MAAELAGDMGKVGFAVVDPTAVVIARREIGSLLDKEVKGGYQQEVSGAKARGLSRLKANENQHRKCCTTGLHSNQQPLSDSP